MSDEQKEKLDTTEFLLALNEINQRLASIETSLNTFPAKFDKMEDRLENYHNSAINTDNKAEKAYILAENNEEETKSAKLTAETAEDKADKAQISVENISKEFQEYKENNKHDKDSNIGIWSIWTALGTSFISAIITVWLAFK